ncbi:FAD-dependent oxidoreductase [Brevibacillus fluminis]|uniref:FAD-dependent oxidoreductase n=1 Tax=Brevibacillus fluminis TaxID=511487 RepID=A0A3M8CZN8_9BACL|nr:FAD-dependent oxidoreductase [Brevibacillus fluminis]RNB81193.1 FAD-dependent oxidoreductase [Brevibacillus fluminis]
MSFTYLFTPVKIGSVWIKNRILSTGHMTTFVDNYLPTDQFIRYHRERAKGGAGLIVIEANAVHPSAIMTPKTISALQDEVIPYYRKLAEAVRPYDTRVFAQLFHPGREISPSGTAIPLAPSTIPSDRFRIMPKELEKHEIQEIINGYGNAAARVKQGGLDGVEIVASHGYLISQFWSPRMNYRTDQYGGSFSNRMRFFKEVLAAVRSRVGVDYPVGLRISVDDFVEEGLGFQDVLEITTYIDQELGGVSYLGLTGGSSSTYLSSVFIAPPAPIPPAHFASYAGQIKERVSIPIFVNSRINDPVIAEKVLANGQADMVGMTRALICDPHMPNKALRGEFNRIRLCIACNQACIGHMQNDQPISCIQNPVTGRELSYSDMEKATNRKNVVIVGGGPAGMKAAVTAAERGHKVTLLEKSGELGGQVKLARRIPGREEFGELIPNLKSELEHYRVDVHLNTETSKELLANLNPDELIIATGSIPYIPKVGGIDLPHVMTTWDILEKKKSVGNRVLIVDWKGEMAGVGTALYLRNQGYDVEIITNCLYIGFGLQSYVRSAMLSQLYTKNVEMLCNYKLHHIEPTEVTFENIYNGEKIVRKNVDTVVLACGNMQQIDLYKEIKAEFPNARLIGDSLLPRTVEEAILEGFELAAQI